MSNLTSFILASFFSILSIGGSYFLIKKWPKFHTTLIGKVLKVLCALMLLIVIAVSLIAAYYSFDNYWEDDRVRVISEFQGVKLGWSKDEVLFRKGEPTFADVDNKNQELIYGAVTVLLDKNKVIAIQYDCKYEEYNYEKVGGISCNDDVDRIILQYGKAKNTVASEDRLRRLYNYPEYNLAFALSKSKVDLLTVIDSKNSPNGYKFKIYPWERYSLVEEDDAQSNVDYGALAKKFGGVVIEESGKDKSFTDAEKADGEYVKDDELLAELNSSSTKHENNQTKQMPITKFRLVDVDYDPFNLELDHCAPDIKKVERLRRLALKGAVRETGYQTYSTGNYEIAFSSDNVIRCR